MQKCLPVLVLLAVGASAQFPTQCVLDVGLGAYGLLNAGLAANSAVKSCGDEGSKAACAADIGRVVSGLGTTSGYVADAVGSCGGTEDLCAADVSFAIANVGTALKAAGNAGTTCTGNTKALCLADILSAGSYIALAANDVENAVATCGKSSFALPSPTSLCGRSLAALRKEVVLSLRPRDAATFSFPAHLNATLDNCGACLKGTLPSIQSAIAQNDFVNALSFVVHAGAQC